MDRIDEPEIIDNPNTSPEVIRATLRDQAIVNYLLGGGAATSSHVDFLPSATQSGPVRILDIGCGGADVSRRIVDCARRLHRPIRMTAMDSHPTTLAIARELSGSYPEISFVQGDALNIPFGSAEFDVVTMSTLLHHFSPNQAITALCEAVRVSRGKVIVSDLVRSRLAYIGILIFARLAGFHPVSAHDGAVSVRKAYTPTELADMARQAGLKDFRIHRHPVCRMTLVCRGINTGASQ